MLIYRPARTLGVGFLVVLTLATLRSLWDAPSPQPVPDEDLMAPAARVARETPPTIVEPNEDWLNEDRETIPASYLAPETGDGPFAPPAQFDSSPLR